MPTISRTHNDTQMLRDHERYSDHEVAEMVLSRHSGCHLSVQTWAEELHAYAENHPDWWVSGVLTDEGAKNIELYGVYEDSWLFGWKWNGVEAAIRQYGGSGA